MKELNSKNIMQFLRNTCNVESYVSANSKGVVIELYDIGTQTKLATCLGNDLDEALMGVICISVNAQKIIKGILQ